MVYIPGHGWVTTATRGGYFGGSGWSGGSDRGDTSGWDQGNDVQEDVDFQNSREEARPTPCVSEPPSADLAEINRHAKAAETALRSRTSTGLEFGTIIYTYNGVVSKIGLQTSNLPNKVIFDDGAIPAGARVLAIVHNHPPSGYGDVGSVLSLGDRDMMDSMLEWVFGGKHYTVDPNLLMYVYDSAVDKTYVYDSSNRNSNTPSCYI